MSRARTWMGLSLLVLAQASGACGPGVASERGAVPLESLLGKTRAEVRAQLGPPAHVSQWDSMASPPGASEAELNAWRESILEDIWVYPGKVLSFDGKGVVKKVSRDSDRYLPPRRR